MTDSEVKNRLAAVNQRLDHLTDIAVQIGQQASRLANTPPEPPIIPSGPVLPDGSPTEAYFAELDQKITALENKLQVSLVLLQGL